MPRVLVDSLKLLSHALQRGQKPQNLMICMECIAVQFGILKSGRVCIGLGGIAHVTTICCQPLTSFHPHVGPCLVPASCGPLKQICWCETAPHRERVGAASSTPSCSCTCAVSTRTTSCKPTPFSQWEPCSAPDVMPSCVTT